MQNMGIQIILNIAVVTILLATNLHTADALNWSCSVNGTAVKVVPNKVSGLWYEIARAPSSEVPACLKVTVPDSQVNGEYNLTLDYVNNVNNGWKPTEETLTFPWNEAENGAFNLEYSTGGITVTVHFLYLGQLEDYALVCGYAGIASGISIVRVLSRNKTVSSSIVNKIDTLAQSLGVDLSEITWVQQDGKCNGAGHLTSIGFVILSVVYLMQTIL